MQRRGWLNARWKTLAVAAASGLSYLGCGGTGKKSGDEKTQDSTVEQNGAVNAAAFVCSSPKTASQYVSSVIQDLYGRAATADELSRAQAGVDPEDFIDAALASPEVDAGVRRFVTNLLALDKLATTNEQDTGEKALLSDLAQEPVVLAQRNKDKPWSYLFETTDIFCTDRTARLYGQALTGSQEFTSCKLPQERAGILSLISFLRATSPRDNPQAFYRRNNNYHRAAATLYLIRGIRLAPGLDGPKGEGPLTPLTSCVPTSDMRVTKAGVAFGTASLPFSGATCSSCHAPSLSPLSVAFRRFGTRGEILEFQDIAQISAEDRQDVPVDHLKAILAEQHSCWSDNEDGLPEMFVGAAGLGKLLAKSSSFGRALGVQIPQHLAQVVADDNMVNAIDSSWRERGGTLLAAMRGFFLSESYRCALKAE